MRKICLILFVFSTFLWACNEKKTEKKIPVPPAVTPADTVSKAKDTVVVKDTSVLERQIIRQGLVNIQSVDSSLKIDLRYSTPHNFMGEDVYGDLERIYLQPAVAEKLKNAQKYLKEKDSTLTLLVFDGVRPRNVQRKMWDVVKLPPAQKGKFVSNPNYGSLHNFGAAVDLTISKVNGEELDMGTPYDDTAKLAYPVLEAHFLAQKKLNTEQIKNRQLLRSVMQKAGFFGIQSEWWHFNSCTREAAAQMYKIVE